MKFKLIYEDIDNLEIQPYKKTSDEIYNNILLNGNIIGEIDFSIYDDENALGIGNFEIDPTYRNKGFGSKVIKKVVNDYSNKYDLIYCFVDKDNIGAINLYNKIGKVYFDNINNDNQYYVEFYNSEE